jgi:endonuclease/exonuclease/phosphatase family metal-dependent hydrolase
MRIIFLNSWFGEAGEAFFDFVKEESPKTDIFCFMEFSPDLFTKVSETLSDHNGFLERGTFLRAWKTVDCQVIFARKNLKILSSGRLALYKNTFEDTGFASYITFGKDGEKINVLNVHGKALPGGKMDTPVRLKQSEKIIDFFTDKDGSKIIGGDFNLYPDTRSVKMFEEAGYKNLIRDFNIKNTRNRLSWEQAEKHLNGSGEYFGKQYFADYCFVSPEVKVKNFKVPNIEVSDHLPLILDFEA